LFFVYDLVTQLFSFTKNVALRFLYKNTSCPQSI